MVFMFENLKKIHTSRDKKQINFLSLLNFNKDKIALVIS